MTERQDIYEDSGKFVQKLDSSFVQHVITVCEFSLSQIKQFPWIIAWLPCAFPDCSRMIADKFCNVTIVLVFRLGISVQSLSCFAAARYAPNKFRGKSLGHSAMIFLSSTTSQCASYGWQSHKWIAMLLEYGELQTTLLVDGIPVWTFCFAATNERGIIVAIRKLQIPWDPGDSLTFDMIHLAAYVHLLQMLLMLPWDPGGCAITPGEVQVKSLSMQHINIEGRTLSKRTIVHALYLCLPLGPRRFGMVRLGGKPKFMVGGLSATYTTSTLGPDNGVLLLDLGRSEALGRYALQIQGRWHGSIWLGRNGRFGGG
ncbi:hypothetical protein CFC21_084702 [Triticum aestivum]|uniref:DUF4283 domain-containing protein n=2 Tax=Triticum aestivum TaxID=4565 RepID=A0A9R1L7N3_WHEAT|nr:hypothetical protein CFC21_084702 [Triticum aestivum]